MNSAQKCRGCGADLVDELLDLGASPVASVDRNPYKQGTLHPGLGIAVRDPEAMAAERPDVAVPLPWNLVDELVPAAAANRWGGETHVLRPGPAIVG